MQGLEIAHWAVLLDKIGWEEFNQGISCSLRNCALLSKILSTSNTTNWEVYAHNLDEKIGGGLILEYNQWIENNNIN